MAQPPASLIIPAHNEAAVIGRLLSGLRPTPDHPALEVIVVCNGCTDDTAERAREFPGVIVLETPVPSKQQALRLGDARAQGFPRAYLDADVEIGRADVLRLFAALTQSDIVAVAPRRVIPRAGTSWTVRHYYDVWEALPNVRSAIFGRGVICLSAAGYARISGLGPFLADDLAISAAFSPTERRVVEDAVVVVRPPKVWADLIRRRIRAVAGTGQAYRSDQVWQDDSRTGRADLLAALRARPGLLLRLPVFLAVTVQARLGAARARAAGADDRWLRDESSRQG